MPANQKAGLRDYAVLHFVIITWGITAVLGKLITLDPAVLTAWRTGLAAFCILVFLALRRTAWPPPHMVLRLLATGLLIGLHWFLFFRSARQSTVSGSLAGISTVALWVALLEPLMIRGRRWSWAEGFFAIGVVLGILIIQLRMPAGWTSLTIGDGGHLLESGLFTAVLAAAVAAVFSILNARFVQHHSALVITGIEMASASAICVLGAQIFAPVTGVQWWPTAQDWPWVLILALVCTVLAYSACVWVQRRVSTFSVGIATNLEPIYGMLLAPLVFGAIEHQPPQFYAGTALIIACVLLHTFLVHRTAKHPPAAPSPSLL